MKKQLTIMAAAVFFTAAFAQYGTPDPGFNSSGKIDSPFPTTNSITTDNNGKILVLGHDNVVGDNIFLNRYNANGTLDNNFGTGGTFEYDLNSDYDYGRCVKALPDGKYLISGQNSVGPYFRAIIVRVNSNGTLDNTFGNNGTLIINPNQANCDAWSMEVAPGGSIYVAGYRTVSGTLKAVVWKVTPNGTLDAGFGSSGEKVISTNSYTERLFGIDLDAANNRLVVAGFSNTVSTPQGMIALLDTNGNLINSFNSGSVLKFSYQSNPTNLYDVVFANNGIVAVGNHIVSGNTKALVCSYSLSGSLNNSFGTSGFYVDNTSSVSGYQAVVRDCGGSLYTGGNVLQGNYKTFRVSRLSSGGAPDNAFGSSGHYTVRIRNTNDEFVEALCIYNDSGIVFGGRINSGSTLRSGIVKLNTADCNNSTSVDEIRLIASSPVEMLVFPNPVTFGKDLVLVSEQVVPGTAFRIISVDGKVVHQGVYEKENGVVLPGSMRLSPGIYQLLIAVAEKLESLQFIVE